MNAVLKHHSRDEISLIYQELNGAIRGHTQWLHDFHSGLVAEEKIDEKFLCQESHRHCPFGEWLYHDKNPLLGNIEMLQPVEELHRKMHDEAHNLASMYDEGIAIPVKDYGTFIEHLALYQELTSNFRDTLQEAETMFDSLTGLFSRQSMMPLLSHEYARVCRGFQECVVVMMDIDHFKAVNDNYGHQAGDQVLHQVGQHIRDHIRPYDSAFRYGGEEFLICLPNSSADDAVMIMDRLREELSVLPICLPGGKTLQVTVSIGIAMISSESRSKM